MPRGKLFATCTVNELELLLNGLVDKRILVGVIQEMCETTLGNNLYGILRRHPFSLEQPIPFDLEDIQRIRTLHYDTNIQEMFFDMRTGSDYELLVRDEEVRDIKDIKPFVQSIPPSAPAKSVFDKEYIPYDVPVKPECEDVTMGEQQVISHLITQLGMVAKAIKQELLDNTAREISE